MTPRLDPVTARLFPSLAAYARKVRRREILALVGLALSAYIIGRDVLSAYQLRAAKENMSAMVGHVAALEDQYQRDHPGLRVSKVQANDWAWTREKALRTYVLPDPSKSCRP